MRPTTFVAILVLSFTLAGASWAAAPPCLPCPGLSVADTIGLDSSLTAAPAMDEEARLYARWRHRVGTPWSNEAAVRVEVAGATPWVTLELTTPSPVLSNVERFEAELEAVAAIARDAGPLRHFQLVWRPSGDPAFQVDEYAFLFKRASIAITGAIGDARILPQPMAADPELIRAFYDENVAAYLDGIVVDYPVDEGAIAELRRAVDEVDPGRTLVVDSIAFPDPAVGAIADLARFGAAGASITFFETDLPSAEEIAALTVVANEFQGDLAFDRYSVPTATSGEAWTFVRGEDLSLRVVARTEQAGDQQELLFTDSTLRRPERISLRDGERSAVFDQSRAAGGLTVRPGTDPVVLLSLERPSIAELDGIEEQVEVATDRYLPVEEILRRLQAFEDDQGRRLPRYEANAQLSLRFQGAGTGTFEVTFEGPYFYEQGEGFDWAWERFFVNGVAWRSSRVPDIPLVQPERAAAPPVEIDFDRRYVYRLRGTDVVDGRDTWVVDFEPADATLGSAENLWQGTVWVDREHFGRVRTRALQLGLQGDVISNEEILHYRPIDTEGEPTAWTPDALWLPTRVTGQQLLSILNNPIPVVKETVLTGLRLDPEDFETRREEILASDATMIRDTDEGWKYLVKDDETGERVVQDEWDKNRLFLLGGVFVDDALDFPLPLVGVNYFSFDAGGTGNQTNVFFAGALLVADIARPSLFGSRFDAGADLFAIAIALEDTLYRDGEEVEDEAVKVLPASVDLSIGRPIGSFFRLGLNYDIGYRNFQRADDTADELVLPSDHILHSAELEGRYSRAGYRLTARGSFNHRSDWEPWGLPGQSFDPDTQDFSRWEFRFAKNFYLKNFQRFSIGLDYFDGENLDRFSKYQVGTFGGATIQGFQSSKVRAEQLYLAHIDYGFRLGEVIRFEGILDAGLATDEESGLDDELLAGIGISGQMVGPWQTIIRADIGTPIAGPDDGFTAQIVFLKLFR